MGQVQRLRRGVREVTGLARKKVTREGASRFPQAQALEFAGAVAEVLIKHAAGLIIEKVMRDPLVLAEVERLKADQIRKVG